MTDFDELQASDQRRVVLVTGPSGAGRSTAINVLEDLDYEVIDNIPLSILPKLLEVSGKGRPLALGLDVRNRDFSVGALIELIDQLGVDPDFDATVLYLDCHGAILRRGAGTRWPPQKQPKKASHANKIFWCRSVPAQISSSIQRI